MAILKIYNDIVDETERLFLRDIGADGVCYKSITEFLESIDENDSEIDLRIHCKGGLVVEGWAIYDALRDSGKTIKATIEGECSSMATIILLAAPKERRFAYANATLCIHNPALCYLESDYYTRLTADKLDTLAEDIKKQADMLREEQTKMVDLYVERTGADRAELESLMSKDIFINMARAKELGFISETVVPVTAFNKPKFKSSKQMAQKESKVQVKQGLLDRLLSMAGLTRLEDVRMVDQVITAADGSEFTVEREDGDPQVGDKAYPNGTYVLEDGTTIVIEGEVITDIIEPGAEGDEKNENENEGGEPTVEELQKEVEELKEKVAEDEQQKEELKKEVEELKETVAEQAKALKGTVAISSDEKKIIDKVNGAGGIAWLNKVLSMKSTYTASNRKFVDHTDGHRSEESPTQKALREAREKAEAKRKAKA